MTQFLLIRHGETAWNIKKRYQGQTDIGLTAKGRKQAAELARAVKTLDLDVLFASSLKRSRQTANILGKAAGLKPMVDERLNELHFGKWEGRTAEELSLKKDPAFMKWRSGVFVTPPQGESLQALRRRIRKFIKDCLGRYKGKKIALVSHAGPIKVFIFEALHLPLRSLWSVQIEPASVSMISFYTRFVQLNFLNLSASSGGWKIKNMESKKK